MFVCLWHRSSKTYAPISMRLFFCKKADNSGMVLSYEKIVRRFSLWSIMNLQLYAYRINYVIQNGKAIPPAYSARLQLITLQSENRWGVKSVLDQ